MLTRTFLLALAAFAMLAAGASAAPKPVTAKVAAVTCAKGLPATARCGVARLPLDYDRPSRGTVKVAFSQIPARRRSQGTIVPLVGGPGGALSASPEFVDFVAASPDFDALLVDVRGTGRSTFLRCAALEGELLVGEPAVVANGRCGRELGERGRFFNSTATAADIESIRRTLGLPAPRLIGISYGTFLATTYLRLFPRVAQAAVLDGAFPVTGDRFLKDIATGTTRVAGLICARSRSCDGAAATAAIAKVAADLRSAPRPLSGSLQPLTESLFATVIGPLLQAGGSRVVGAVIAAAAGDDRVLQQLIAASVTALPAGQREFSSALGIAVQCNDYDYAYDLATPVAARRAALQRALAALPDDAFGAFSKAGWTGLGNDHPSTCLEWPTRRPPRSQRLPTGPLPTTPVLVLNGDFDLQTPIEGARRAAARFPSSVLVTVPNAPHVTLTASPCAQRVASTFLDRRRLPVASACAREPVAIE